MPGEKDKDKKIPDRASRSGSIDSSKKKSDSGKKPDDEPKVEVDPELLPRVAGKKPSSGDKSLSSKVKPKSVGSSTAGKEGSTGDKGASKKKSAGAKKPDGGDKGSGESKSSRKGRSPVKGKASSKDSSGARKSLSDRKKSLSDRKKSLSDGKKSLSDRKKSLSDSKKSLSDSKKSLSDRKKSPSDSKKTSSRPSSRSSSASRRSSSARSSSSSRSSRGDDEGSLLTRRYLRIPMWGWLLVATAGFGAAMVVVDLRNQERYLMVCRQSAMEIHSGKRLPWPFGHERVGGAAFRPVSIPAGTDCRPQVFNGRREAQTGMLDYLLVQIKAALSRPGVNDLKESRSQALQAMLLTKALRDRSGEVKSLRAELAYRQGRNGVARIEDELRTTLNRFREARKLDPTRFKDLDEWIDHLQDLLESVSPSPRKKETTAEKPAPPPPPPPVAVQKPDAGAPRPKPAPAPDAAQPEEATGTLM